MSAKRKIVRPKRADVWQLVKDSIELDWRTVDPLPRLIRRSLPDRELYEFERLGRTVRIIVETDRTTVGWSEGACVGEDAVVPKGTTPDGRSADFTNLVRDAFRWLLGRD